MNFSNQHQEPGKKLVGIIIVVLIHVALIYALLHGLGTQIISFVQEHPIQAQIIEEAKPVVPLPPAPPKIPKTVTPTRPVVPQPEVPVQQSPAPEAIEAVNRVASPSEAKASTPAPASVGPVVIPAVVDFSSCAKPDYPRNSLRNEEQGTVRIQFLIGLDGRVADSKIDKSSGFRGLDAAAKKALSLCRFKPGTVDGKPQQSWTTVDYVWRLPD